MQIWFCSKKKLKAKFPKFNYYQWFLTKDCFQGTNSDAWNWVLMKMSKDDRSKEIKSKTDSNQSRSISIIKVPCKSLTVEGVEHRTYWIKKTSAMSKDLK